MGRATTIRDQIDQLTGLVSQVASGLAAAYAPHVIRKRGKVPTLLRVLLITLVSIWTLPLHAQSDHGVTLQWDAPPECPTVKEVYRTLGRLLPRGFQGSRVRSVRASARIVRTEQGLREELRTFVDGRHGVRTLEAPACDSLARATAVFLALIVEPEALLNDGEDVVAEARAHQQVTDPSSETPGEPPPNRPSLRVPSTTPLHIVVELGGGIGTGPVPNPNVFFSGGLGFQLSKYSVALEATWSPQRTVYSSSDSRRGGTFESIGLGARGCRAWPSDSPLSLAGCAGLEAIRMTAVGIGPDVIATPRHETWLQFFGAGQLSWALTPRLGWAGRLDLGIPTARHDFTIDGAGSVRSISPVFVRAVLHFYANL